MIALKWTLTFDLKKSDLGEMAQFTDLKHEEYDCKVYLQQYHKYCYHFWRPEESRAYTITGFKGFNSGCFLTGRGGCGKSGVLTYVVAWAHENEWVVVAIPWGRDWVDH